MGLIENSDDEDEDVSKKKVRELLEKF